MNQRQEREQRARAGRVYVWLLRLYPTAYRRAFGPPMLQTFRDHYQDAIQTKEESALRFWLGVLLDEGKSIIREHLAVLKERKATMKKLPLIGLAVGGVLLIVLMQFFPRSSGSGFSLLLPVLVIFALLAALALFAAWLVFIRKTSLEEWPPIALAVGGVALLLVLGWLNVGFQGMLSFVALSMTFLLLFGPIIAGLLAIIARFVRTLPQPAAQPGWVRVGLVLGGMIACYEVVSDVLRVLLPSSEVGRLLGGIVPLLLIGVVGVIGGYASGRTRTGAYAGLLAGFMGLVVDQASQVVLLVLLWPTLQHGTLQSFLTSDYHYWVQRTSKPLTLANFLNFEFLEDGIGFIVMTSLIILAGEGLFAWVGSMMGAAFRRAGNRAERASLLHPSPVGFILVLLALSLLVWAGAAEVQSLAGNHHLLPLGDLSSSFTTPAGLSWLLGFVVILAFVFVAARRTPTQQEASDVALPG